MSKIAFKVARIAVISAFTSLFVALAIAYAQYPEIMRDLILN